MHCSRTEELRDHWYGSEGSIFGEGAMVEPLSSIPYQNRVINKLLRHYATNECGYNHLWVRDDFGLHQLSK